MAIPAAARQTWSTGQSALQLPREEFHDEEMSAVGGMEVPEGSIQEVR